MSADRRGGDDEHDRSPGSHRAIFALMALVHLYRLFAHFQIVLGIHAMPHVGRAIVGVVIAAGLSWMLCREREGTRPDPSDVEAEQHHVAVLDDIVLAFGAQLAGVAGARFAAELDEVVVGDGLGADEAALEVGVDLARRLGRPRAPVHGPGARLPSGRR